MTARKAISLLLLAFVLVTVGFILGKETTLRSQQRAVTRGAAASQPAGDKVIVYSMHQTYPCVTCTAIEKLTDQLLKTQFASELQSGQLEFRQEDFQKNEELAKRYDLASSTVVVVQMRGGREVRHKRLDDVWTAISNADKFNTYVGGAIREFLGGGNP